MFFAFGPVLRRSSEKNGEIQVQRTFTGWRITVNEYEVSSPYMNGLWRAALRRIPERASIRRILFLGFGAGGNVRRLHRLFPQAHITSVEWDPEMIRLAYDLKTYPIGDWFEVVLGDAREVVHRLEPGFDLIIFDLYRGRVPIGLEDPVFVRRLADLLAPDGYGLINIFDQRSCFLELDRVWSRVKTWRYWFNTIALYRSFSQQLIGAPLPSGYQNFRAVPAYLEREFAASNRRILRGKTSVMGTRAKQGFWSEVYLTDEEPELHPDEGPRRLVIWQPLTRQCAPKGWWQSWTWFHMHRTGFGEMTNPAAYWKAWHKHAQRHRQRWFKEEDVEIVSTDFRSFYDAYQRWCKWTLWLFKGTFLDHLKKREARHPGLMRYRFAKKKSTGEILAGFASLDIPEASQSLHVISFIRKGVTGSSSVGVGLMDDWYRYAVEKGFKFLDFDLFRAPGEPRSWRGFTRFKGYFVTRFIDYPKPFLKIIGRKNSSS